MRIHHCYADGIALVQVMLSMTEATARASLALAGAGHRAAGGAARPISGSRSCRPVGGALEGATRVGRSLLDQGKELAANPALAQEAIEGVTRKGMDFAGELARLALMGSDSPTRFKGRLGREEARGVGRALSAGRGEGDGQGPRAAPSTTSSSSMAAGALRDYLASKGDAVDGLQIRAIVPVNLRPDGKGRELGNQFGLVFLDLPIGIDHPLERLYEVRRRMQALKGSYQPIIVLGLLHTVGHGPKILQEQVTALLSQNASAVMTNVPGPQHPIYFAGRRIEELNFWVPQSGGIGMGVSILSYDGRIQFGLITDAGLVPDPDRIVARFHGEFEKLMWLTLMSPWEDARARARFRHGSASPPRFVPREGPAGFPVLPGQGSQAFPRALRRAPEFRTRRSPFPTPDCSSSVNPGFMAWRAFGGPETRRAGNSRPACPACGAGRSRAPPHRLLQVLGDELGHLEHRDGLLAAENFAQLVVGVDVAAVDLVLEAVLLDVGPELAGDFGARLGRGADHGGERGARHEGLHESGVGLALGCRSSSRRASWLPFSWRRASSLPSFSRRASSLPAFSRRVSWLS